MMPSSTGIRVTNTKSHSSIKVTVFSAGRDRVNRFSPRGLYKEAEGFELYAMMGGLVTFANTPARHIVAEFYPPLIKCNVTAVHRVWMRVRGYALFDGDKEIVDML